MLGFTPATSEALSLAAVPIGSGIDYWGTTLPGDNWKWADGSAISRTTYATAFARLGTTYGAGDGTTTFNLPDKRGRASVARDDLGGTAASRLTSGVSGIAGDTLGASGGDQRLQSHTHTITDPGHTHTITPPAASDTTSSGQTATGTGGSETISSYSTASATTGITVDTAGAGGSQNVQPSIVCNYIIRVL
jgi:microcystin-dependent protein